jgi:glycosyltransferase involved in cell wall biosynthesis
MQDSRIKVIHKPNGGPASARQAGLDAASGRFIGWVDSDDWIETEFFSEMIVVQQETKADIVTSGLFIDIGMDSHKLYDDFVPGIYTPTDLVPKLLYSGKFFEYGIQPHMVTKLFRRQIVKETHKLVDQRFHAGEDAAVVYPSILEAGKIAVTDICDYHYIQNPGSLSRLEKGGEAERLQRLMNFLEKQFIQRGMSDVLLPQLEQYKKCHYAMRCMQAFEPGILMPYGGLPKGSRVVIYGAGVLGQQIYRYLSKYHENDIGVVLWIDRDAAHYQKIGMDVYPLEKVESLTDRYDYVLIANTIEASANEMRNCLQELHVPIEKIRWFSKEFIECKHCKIA